MNAVVGLLGVVMLPPVPETIVQRPVPIVGVLAASVVDVLHKVWSGPALDTVGLAVKVTSTSSVDAVHGAFEIVQRSVYTVPVSPVKPEVGLEGAPIVPPTPETTDHEPVPEVGVLPNKVVDVPQRF